MERKNIPFLKKAARATNDQGYGGFTEEDSYKWLVEQGAAYLEQPNKASRRGFDYPPDPDDGVSVDTEQTHAKLRQMMRQIQEARRDI